MQPINMNDFCRVKLTAFGHHILESHYKGLYQPKQRDDGFYRFQMWELFQVFGSKFHLGMNEIPFVNNEIQLEVTT